MVMGHIGTRHSENNSDSTRLNVKLALQQHVTRQRVTETDLILSCAYAPLKTLIVMAMCLHACHLNFFNILSL